MIAASLSLAIAFGFIGYSSLTEQEASIQQSERLTESTKKKAKKTPYLNKAEKDKAIEIITKENKVKLLEQQESVYYVYFYRSDCEYCQKLAPTMNKYIKYYGSDLFYFVNTDTVLDDDYVYADTDDLDRSEIESFLISNSTEDHTAWMIEGTPTVFKIENHSITKIYEGNSQIKELLKDLKEEGARS